MCSFIAFETALGWMAVVWSSGGLRRVVLPQGSREIVLEKINRSACPVEEAPYPHCLEVIQRIRDYLDGREVEFHYRLDLSGISDFRRRVYGVVERIPRGEMRSYSWVAYALGLPGSARAVGQALARNPFPIVVPCHRVVRSDGSLGDYSGGVDLKKKLLELEGAAGFGPR